MTPKTKFDKVMRLVLSVSKAEMQKRLETDKQARDKRTHRASVHKKKSRSA